MGDKRLKPCPFCGGEAEYLKVGNTKIGIREATIKCRGCHVQRTQKFRTKAFDFDFIDEAMIGSWNKRVGEEPKEEPKKDERAYKPVCPFGEKDCIFDPAYFKAHHPEEYKREYGNISPEELVKKDYYGCCDNLKNNKYCPDYDDEDK